MPRAGTLPAGLCLPRVHQVDDLGEDRLALWLEDVATIDTPWDLPRFRRAARLRGQLAARLTRATCLPRSTSGLAGEGNRVWYTGRVRVAALPQLREDVTWVHPLVAAGVDPHLRADLAERVPAMLDVLDQLPQTVMHGDASPQNLLVPLDDPSGFTRGPQRVYRAAAGAPRRAADGRTGGSVRPPGPLTRYLVDLGLALTR